MHIMVLENQTVHTISEEEMVKQVRGEHLGSRFSLGKCAPISAQHLSQEIGSLSDMHALQMILSNTYDFSQE